MRRSRMLMVSAATLVLTLCAAPRARAETNHLFDAMPDQQPVRLIVFGWLPAADRPAGRDAAREAAVAGARDEEFAVRRALEATGQPAAVDTPFRYLPFTVVDTTAAAARRLTETNPNATLEIDEEVRLHLTDTPAQVGALAARKNGLTGKGMVVAVIDSGVDTKHPFLAGSVIAEACFARLCPNGRHGMAGAGAARPVDPHGTHVSGIIAGHGDAFSGIAPEAKIVAINVMNEYPSSPTVSARVSDILLGMDYVILLREDAQVPVVAINLSLGGGRYREPCANTAYDRAARILRDHRIVTVASSGNEGFADSMGTPGCAPHIVSVGAIDKKGLAAKDEEGEMFSNSAPFMTIVAPGVQILSSVGYPGKIDFAAWNGTSMAAPHVTAALALVAQAMPDASPEEWVKALLADAPTFTDPRNGIKTPMLHISANLRAPDATTASTKPAPLATAPSSYTTEPMRIPSNWGNTTQ